MQTDLHPEVLLCPNCKEEVPKTLYCLNCGYPLYKVNVESEPAVEKDSSEPVAVVENEAVDEVVEIDPEPTESIETMVTSDEIVEVAPKTMIPTVVNEDVSEIAPEFVKAMVTPEENVEVIPETMIPTVVNEDVIITVDPADENITSVEEGPVVPEYIELLSTPQVEYEAAREPIVDLSVEVEDPVVETIGVTEENKAVEDEEVLVPIVENDEAELVTVLEYEPDPVVKEVMENLAKNISMKIKLVDLLRTGGVKSEIFSKLFDSYLTRGELLMNSRSEMLERVRYDLGSMEKALKKAKEGLEELVIRKTIEDVSKEEYAAKAPGFQWDINQYKDEVGKKQAESYYLEDIKRVMESDGISELIGIGEGCFEDLDGLVDSDGINDESAAKIRVSLEEALACIR